MVKSRKKEKKKPNSSAAGVRQRNLAPKLHIQTLKFTLKKEKQEGKDVAARTNSQWGKQRSTSPAAQKKEKSKEKEKKNG